MNAQSATEFIILLAVILVVGSIATYLIIGSGDTTANDSAQALELRQQEIGITNYAVSNTQAVINIINNGDSLRQISTITVGGTTCDYSGNNIIPSKGELTITCSNIETSGEYDYEVVITYVERQSGSTHTLAYPYPISGTTPLTTINDTTPPAASAFVASDGATDVSISNNLQITFTENVVKGSGNIVIYDASDDSVVETIAVSATSVLGNTVTINPVSNFAYSTSYYVFVANGAFEDNSGNAFAGISDKTTWNFETEAADVTAPTVSAFSPSDGASGVSVSSNLVVTFSENIAKGTGNIVIYNASDDSVVESIVVSATSVSGDTLTINPSSNLGYGASFYIQIAGTAIDDLAGNSYAGISDTTTWNFATAQEADVTAPTVSAFSPSDGASDVLVESNLVVTFDEDIAKGSGNIVIYNASDDTAVQTIAIGSASVSGNELTINPSDLGYGASYYVQIAGTAIDDLAGNSFAGISDTTTWNFATEAAEIEEPLAVSLMFNKSWASASGGEDGYDLTVDSSGNIIGVGDTRLGYGLYDTAVVKWDTDGNVLWNTSWGHRLGSRQEKAVSVVTDASDNIYVLSRENYFVYDDNYLIKFNSIGNYLCNITWEGDTETVEDMVLSGSNLYVTATNNPGDGRDIGLLIFNTACGLVTSTSWDAPGDSGGYDYAESIAADSNGNIYVTGYTDEPNNGGPNDVFLLKFNSAGVLQWNVTWGGSSSDYGYEVEVDENDDIYVLASTDSFGEFSWDYALLKYNSAGVKQWNISWDGDGQEIGTGLGFDSIGNIYIGGRSSYDFEILKVNTSLEVEWNISWPYVDLPGVQLDGAEALLIYDDYAYQYGWAESYQESEASRHMLLKWNISG